MSEPFAADPDSADPDSTDTDSADPASTGLHGAGRDGASHDASGQYADSRPSGDPHPEPEALVGRLRVIEDQPLEARAAAFGQLHDELRAILEAGQVAPQHHG